MKERRRTKIVATLGPATDNDDILKAMIESGLNCARLNCSHSDTEELKARAEHLRTTSQTMNKSVALLFDLQGPKLRLSGEVLARQTIMNEEVCFVGNSENLNAGDILVETEKFTDLVTEHSEIVIGDGYPRMCVTKIEKDRVLARVTHPGPISSRKGVTITMAGPSSVPLTAKDYVDLKTAAEVGADFIALSFVRKASDLHELHKLLGEYNSRARVVAKIEKLEAIENIDDIIEASHGLLVARGDYGVEAGLSEVPLMQKKVIMESRRKGILSITATQMLESMIESPMPTRAEASDVANAVLDGTSAVMLSAETAVGKYPVEAVRMMADIIDKAENFDELYTPETEPFPGSNHDALMRAAVTLATETNAQAIVIATSSGTTARAACRYRPSQPILALTPFQRVCDQLAIEWGIEGVVFEEEHSTTKIIERLMPIVKEDFGFIGGEKIVVTKGTSEGPNLITLVDIV